MVSVWAAPSLRRRRRSPPFARRTTTKDATHRDSFLCKAGAQERMEDKGQLSARTRAGVQMKWQAPLHPAGPHDSRRDGDGGARRRHRARRDTNSLDPAGVDHSASGPDCSAAKSALEDMLPLRADG